MRWLWERDFGVRLILSRGVKAMELSEAKFRDADRADRSIAKAVEENGGIEGGDSRVECGVEDDHLRPGVRKGRKGPGG